MTVVVVSQAWTREGFREHPGYRGRQLVRGVEDPTHFTHLRFFDSVESYEECTRAEGYQDHLVAMYAHLRPYDSYPREYLEVVLDEQGNA